MNVEIVPLRDLCEVRIGRTPSRSNQSFWGGPGVWITISELNGGELRDSKEHISQLAIRDVMPPPVPAGTLLFSFKLSIGKMGVSAVPLYTNEAIAALPIRDPNRLDREYLRYALMATSGSVQANHAVLGAVLNKAKVEALPIPVRPISEQRRIVDLLSRAENIVRMRREAEKKAKEIIPALFLDMFGDPARNPKGWGIESLAEVVAIESPLRTPNFMTEATEVCIGPDSIESMTGQLLSQPTVGDIRPISGKYRYRCRDVLYSKIRPALVKVALAPSDGYCSADMYPLRCGPKLQPEYLTQILLNQHFTRYALDRATRAQMPKINREALFAYRLPVPPIDLQESFARHCQGYMGVREQQRRGLGVSELGFQSLLSGVFGE
jgi:type I restriction enzyme S subunit